MFDLKLTVAAASVVAITALPIGSAQARPLTQHPMPGRAIATGKIDLKAPLPPINPFRPIRAVTTGTKTLRAI
jgi:ABC-type sulfate transport system permease component